MIHGVPSSTILLTAIALCLPAACDRSGSGAEGSHGTAGAAGAAGGTGGAAGDSGPGGRCGTTAPTAFPYAPACCSYQVSVPEADEAGFDSPALGDAPTPDHVHVSWAGDPSTTFAVNWRTDTATLGSRVLVGPDEASVAAVDGADAGRGVIAVAGHHLLYGSSLDGSRRTRVHEAHVCGLEPSKRYFYKVGAPGAWSDVFDVTTGPPRGSTEPFTFAVTGDSRDRFDVWAEVQKAVGGHGPDFQVFTGDAVLFGSIQTGWNSFFEATAGDFAVQDVLARTPFLAANGNHDALALNYLAQFALPQELSEGESAAEEWYSLDYANAHFVFLNDTTPATKITGDERDWLEADLEKVDRKTTPWLFVVHHKTTYSCSKHGSNMPVREAWQPLFDRFGVDVVLAGHDHVYERSYPIRGFQAGTSEGAIAETGPNAAPVAGSGTVYVTTGGAGAPLYGADDTCPHTYLTESIENYLILEVENRKMTLTAYRLNGTVLDSFETTK